MLLVARSFLAVDLSSVRARCAPCFSSFCSARAHARIPYLASPSPAFPLVSFRVDAEPSSLALHPHPGSWMIVFMTKGTAAAAPARDAPIQPSPACLPPNRRPMPATLFAVECRYPPMPPPRLLVRPAHTRSHLVVNPISSHPPTPLRNSLALGASRTDVDAHRIVARARSLQSWLLMRVCFLPSLPLWLCS